MTDKERLERIIQMQYDGYTIWDMGENDLIWLIEQAGRVQELEEEVDRLNGALHYQLSQENIRNEENRKLKHKNKRYHEALEFYADEEHYKEKLISEAQYDADGICISNDEYAPPIIYFDSGEKARKALEESK